LAGAENTGKVPIKISNIAAVSFVHQLTDFERWHGNCAPNKVQCFRISICSAICQLILIKKNLLFWFLKSYNLYLYNFSGAFFF
jgi:hypothetical protein